MRWLLIIGSALALAVALAVGWANWWPHDEPTEMTLHHPSGHVTVGTKFGVTIGDPWAKADVAIRRRITPGYVLWEVGKPNGMGGGISTPDKPVLVGEAEVTYRDRSWRNGMITLTLRDGRVTMIAWDFSPGYIDL